MKLRIAQKLVLGFALVILLMAVLSAYLLKAGTHALQQSVGENSMFLAGEMLKRIDNIIYQKAEELQIHCRHLPLIQAVTASNKTFQTMDNREEWMEKMDREWITGSAGNIPVSMQRVIDRDLSRQLKKEFIEFYKEKYGHLIFSELFVTNRYGANIAQTGRTSDYRQDDEKWWQMARQNGVYIDDVIFDESAATHAIPIGIRIEGKNREFIGVMKAILNVKGIIREAEIETRKYETTRIELITKAGRVIYRSKSFQFLEDVSIRPYFKNLTKNDGFFVMTEGKRKKLYAYTRSKGYKNFGGFGWTLIERHDLAELLHPVLQLRNNMLGISLVLMAAGMLVAIFISRSIIRPIARLHHSMEIISSGNFDHSVGSSAKDEIGQLSRVFDGMIERLKETTVSRNELAKEVVVRKKTAKELEERSRHLEAAVGELEDFSYAIAHDLKAPLRNIHQLSGWLLNDYKDTIDKKGREQFDLLADKVVRMENLIDGLLQYARIGRNEQPPWDIDLDILVDEVVGRVVLPPHITIRVQDRLPTVKGVELRLKQVFENLMDNAVRYMDKDEGRVRVICSDDGPYWKFGIVDNGPGIDARYHEKIFEVFQVLPSGQDTNSSGTGIGLSLVKKIVEMNGGRVWVTSDPGRGCTFYFTWAKNKEDIIKED